MAEAAEWKEARPLTGDIGMSKEERTGGVVVRDPAVETVVV